MTLTENERLSYATAEADERYKLCSTARTKIRWSKPSWTSTPANPPW